MKNIVINATAAHSSGALSILKDFISYIYKTGSSKYMINLITSTKKVFINSKNLSVYEVPLQNWITRLNWDRRGFRKWCEKHNIIPDVVISFQNTCPKLTGPFEKKILVYYHQNIPLVKYKWKWYRFDEFKLFLYAHFYSIFVNRWNKNAEYVVQLPSVKELFCNKFPKISENKVHVIYPNLPDLDVASVSMKENYSGKKMFLFPAMPLRYKNHIVILEALNYLRIKNPENLSKIKIVFTIPKKSFVAKKVKAMNLDTVVDCIDSISYDELLSYYKRCDALLFPSKVESFGLPLIEAALFGIPVIASDLPFAREVLEKYSNSAFINSDDYISWANAINEVCMNEKKIKPMIKENKNTWEEFEQLMLSL